MEIISGKYALLNKIGEGGQGEVYLAKQINTDFGLEKKVVIKFFPKNDFVKKYFVNEVKILSKLDHPNIISILDVGETEEKYFLVLEYFGISLKEFCKQAFGKNIKLNKEFFGYIALEIFKALDYAHHFKTGKVLHKDISPQNILISEDGRVKLIDFGISELEGKTEHLHSKGKAAYLPESILNGTEEYSEHTDIYSLMETIVQIVKDFQFEAKNAFLDKLKATQEKELNYETLRKDLTSFGNLDNSTLLNFIKLTFDRKIVSENTEVSLEDFSNRDHGFFKKIYSKNKSTYLKIFIGFNVFWILLILIGLYENITENQFNSKFTFNLKNEGQVQNLKPSFQLINSPSIEDSLKESKDPCEIYCSYTKSILNQSLRQNYDNLSKQDGFKNYDYVKFLSSFEFPIFKRAINFYKKNEQFCSESLACKSASTLVTAIDDNILNGGKGVTTKDRYINFFNSKNPILKELYLESKINSIKDEKILEMLKIKNGVIYQLGMINHKKDEPLKFFNLNLTKEEKEYFTCEKIAFLYYFFFGSSYSSKLEIGPEYKLEAIGFSKEFKYSEENNIPTLEFFQKGEIESCAFIIQNHQIKFSKYWKFNN